MNDGNSIEDAEFEILSAKNHLLVAEWLPEYHCGRDAPGYAIAGKSMHRSDPRILPGLCGEAKCDGRSRGDLLIS